MNANKARLEVTVGYPSQKDFSERSNGIITPPNDEITSQRDSFTEKMKMEFINLTPNLPEDKNLEYFCKQLF
ncbi:unnamed protein product, partial [Allacma fusca]